ncbi:MAG: glycosyltransferase family 4 protein [Candidatus Rokubacteria bacterium]|nr:glycosyltransferase family 4 protein [Candidatus Rokubacteria bacterium]
MTLDLLLVTAYFPPDNGSASHLFAELGTALAGRGHRVTVLTGFPGYYADEGGERYRGRLRVCERTDGITVIRTATPRLPQNIPLLRAVWQFSEAAALLSAGVTAPKASAALVYSPPLPLGLTGWALHRLRGVPFVLNVQDLFPQSVIDLGLLTGRRAIRLAEGMERFVYRRAAHLTVHSEGNRDHVIGKGVPPTRVTVIPNWVDTDAIRPGSRINDLRAGLGLRPEHFVVSFAGVIGYSQDLDTVLDCAQRLRAERDVVFLIVGDGVEKARLEEKARALRLDNARFLPMQPKARYPLVLDASDVCLATLHASVRTPVVPSKILSIMAAARPVLAALHRDGDAARLIEESGAGLCVPPGDAEALAAAVLKFRADRQWAEALGRQARRFAVAELSLSRAVDRYEGLLRGVANTPGR